MRLPTASSLDLAAACPASHVLPQIRTTTEAMLRGTAVHHFLEQMPQVGRDRALAEVPDEHRALCEAIDPAEVPEGDREIAYAWNVDTGEVRRLGHIEHRAYPRLEGRWIFGTADVVSVDHGSFVCPECGPCVAADEDGCCATCGVDIVSTPPSVQVLDYKVTDVPHDEQGLLNPTRRSLQLRVLALMVMRHFNAEAERRGGEGVEVVESAHLRVTSSGRIEPDRATLGFFDWPVIEEEVRQVLSRVQAEHAEATPGPHCGLCPCIARCPATTALISTVGQMNPEPEDWTDPGIAWLWLQQAEALVRALRAELMRRAAVAPIPLPDGSVLASVEELRERLDPRVVWAVLTNELGEDQAWAALGTSKSAIQRVMGPGTGASFRSILTEIRYRGGANLIPSSRLQVVKNSSPTPRIVDDLDVDPLDFHSLV